VLAVSDARVAFGGSFSSTIDFQGQKLTAAGGTDAFVAEVAP
jgi:hypothetical protein